MSARKPLARMEFPTITESLERQEAPIENSSAAETTVCKSSTTENENKSETTINQCEIKESDIKQEKQDFDEVKRVTRNSPMMQMASPLKKKPSDSVEQDSSSESTRNEADEVPKSKDKNDKPHTSRGRKPLDPNKPPSTSIPPTNRLTRKAAMKDWAANTRLTRARRASAGMGQKPETNSKKKNASKKNQADPPAPAVKRKRSISPKPSSEEPEAKIIKTEVIEFDMDTITIKQEILESSEEMTSDVASDITDMFPAEPTGRISLRARKTTMCYSPTTRPYRKDKDKPDGRKKKQNRIRPDEDSKDSMTSSTIEEDVSEAPSIADVSSKADAAASCTDSITVVKEEIVCKTPIDVAAVTEIEPNENPAKIISDQLVQKVESTSTIDKDTGPKPSQKSLNSGEAIDIPLETIDIPLEAIDIPLESIVARSESIDIPLSVDTTDLKKDLPSTSAAAGTPEPSNTSEKSASLSPEMVSEGVCEMSVKQFYKKPEFMENNLGIENDPKLGEIVQNVSDRMDDAADQTSISNDSIKEGELVFEEDEDVESIGTIKNDHEEDDDANSVSTGFISPLLVEEEEEENEEQTFLNGDENIEDTSITEDVSLEEEPEEAKIEDGEAVEMEVKESKSEEIAPKEITTMESNSEEQLPEALNVKVTSSEEVEIKEYTKANSDDMETEEIKDEKIPQDTKVEILTTNVVEKQETKIEKTEICDKTIESDNGIKNDEIKTLAIKNKIELPEEEKAIVKEIEVDEPPKIETSGTDQEENKENMELQAEAVKPEDCEESEIKTPVEKESSSADEQEECNSESSKNSSPSKAQVVESSGEATTPSTSPQSSKSSCVPRTPENDEKLRQKERHLKTLGLLTHKAADEAIMAKQKRRKFLHNLSNNSSSKKNSANATAQSGSGSTAGNGQNKSSQEYTGTLKTIIKINRQSGGGGNGGGASEPKKGKNGDGNSNKASTSGYGNRRQSLKMTFQKGRGRPANTEKSGENPANTSSEHAYYTIQNEIRGGKTSATAASTVESSMSVPATSNVGRKSYNRSNTLNTTDPTPLTEHHEIPATSKKDEKEEILIPEKASSFKFHPGRLCQDQCYYCSGKFGLYDTPCHVGQIKSVERQQKILSNEEKLTVDNCLCDACFRHVDRRANVPSYKKRLSVPGRIETTTTSTTSTAPSTESPPDQEKPQHLPANSLAGHSCAVPDCELKATHSLRRKSIRKSVKKSLLNFDMSTATGTYLYICDKHYEAVAQSSGCVLCKRRLGKNNMYHITTDTDRLEKALADMGIPVTMGQCTAVCKLCRYFANLLMKPPEHGKVQKVEFVKNYRKRLLQFYNIHDKKDTSQEEEKVTDKEKEKEKEKAPKKQKSCSTAINLEEPTVTIEVPPSPTHSTGSSVEMISDGGLFSGDESLTAKKPASASNSTINQMVLANDVLVDYDIPMISDTSSTGSSNSTSPSPLKIKQAKDQQSKLKAILQSVGTSLEDRSDISTALRSNPNISMRELFPGEEDLGLQFKAPFGGRSAQRTPEGWTRINTFLQYDEPTRQLWENLQKPYGNQSSFLRHLILLEKYYRNGDLILSSNASSNATVYTETVRNRLTSFDSRCSSPSSAKEIESRPRSLSVDKIQRQLSSNSVTIIARPKDQPKEAESTKQQKELNSSAPSTSSASAISAALSIPNSRSILKANIGIPKGNSSIEVVSLNPELSSKSSSPHSPTRSGSTTPNESTMLTKQQKILAAANKLMNNKLDASPTHKKTAFNTTPPELISLNKRPAQAPINTQPIKRPLLPKPMRPHPPNIVVLSDTLTAQERLESKSWRPTLLPVSTTSHHLNNQQGPLYQTADGRRLPALVQVQSGGRPFLISIHDYNRMCILRREKLMRDQMLKGSKGKLKGSVFPPATCTSNSNSSSSSVKQPPPPPPPNPALLSFNKTMQAVSAAEIAAKKQRLMLNKSTVYTPIAPKPMQTSLTTTSATATCTSQSQSQSSVPVNLKPISLLSSTPNSGMSIHANLTGQALPLLKPTSAPTLSGVPNNSWLWNNFPDHSQMLINGKSTTSAAASKGPQATFTTMKQQSLLLDNSLMSKIPKSLTVIPQHKLMPALPPTGHMSGGSITKSKD